MAKSPILSIALITLMHQKTNMNPIITSKRIKRRFYLYQVFVFYDSSAGGWDKLVEGSRHLDSLVTNCSAVNYFFVCHPTCFCLQSPTKYGLERIRGISIMIKITATSTNPASSKYSFTVILCLTATGRKCAGNDVWFKTSGSWDHLRFASLTM